MDTERAKAIITAISQRQPFVPVYSQLIPPRIIQCSVSPPVQWNQRDCELTLGITLPTDLVAIWNDASEIRLYEDVNYGQWGCILWSPSEIIARHKKALGWRGEDDFRPGDLIIGEFHGDTELVVLRCAPSEPDFGAVVIALPMDAREDWSCVAPSIGEFILRFLSNPANKFWEVRA